MHLPDFIALYHVALPIAGPILALPGMILTVWPRSETHTLAVCRTAPGFPVERHCHVSPGALYGIVMAWELDGVIMPLSPASALRQHVA